MRGEICKISPHSFMTVGRPVTHFTSTYLLNTSPNIRNCHCRLGPTLVLAVSAMKPISYARHRFPRDVIRHAVWLYLRFTLSYRDVEDLLAERGLTVSNESIRRWVHKFGPPIAKNLRGRKYDGSPAGDRVL